MEQLNLAKIFKALSNEQRCQIFNLLYRGGSNKQQGKSCCAVIEKAFSLACEHLDISRSTISHHFKELRNAGLIECERKGQSINCRVNPQAIDLIKMFLK